jgi:hypothetical protein
MTYLESVAKSEERGSFPGKILCFIAFSHVRCHYFHHGFGAIIREADLNLAMGMAPDVIFCQTCRAD